MDIKDNILNYILDLKPFLNEEYLLNISNKGIYKRAVKDMENITNVSIDIENNKLLVKSDDFQLIIDKENINNMKCSCPSVSICRHKIFALLYIASLLDKENVCENNDSSNDFIDLKELDINKLIKLSGKIKFNKLLEIALLDTESSIEYKEFINITMPIYNETLHLPKYKSIENMICSCKSKLMCQHKIYGLIIYLISHDKIHKDNIDNALFNKDEEIIEFLNLIQNELINISEKGLVSHTETVLQRLETLYIKSVIYKINSIENDLKSIISLLELYFNKHINFSYRMYASKICLLYNRINALKNNDDKVLLSVLQGITDNVERNVNLCSLYGLCVSSLIINGGRNILYSAYFYCIELKKFVALRNILPVELEKSIPSIWDKEINIYNIANKKIKLKNAIFTGGKLSSRKETIVTTIDNNTGYDLSEISVDYETLYNKLINTDDVYFKGTDYIDNIHIIEVKTVYNVYYDNIKQRLNVIISDESDNIIELYIKYNKSTKLQIDWLENNYTKIHIPYILATFYIKRNVIVGELLGCASGSQFLKMG